ncbi:hypothetical protein H632_c310p3 [Helicosporidium sp. ATCC 50920]|nr:hypothetical protein H632_c310p3 [Helicosporidium sp. ATCC 50920]|eukprot:KDD76221.1 hypothetical protein H632_c310p3 [Helicosporidium sp. ATCC 50920]
MPAEGVDLTPVPELLTSAEIVRLAALFARAGVSKVRLTGGEPTLRKDLVELVGQLAALPGVDTVALTTNGITLARQLDELLSAGLTHLNVSLDTLRAERFERLVRRRGHSRVLQAVDRSLEAVRDGRLRSLKVNVVVQRGVNDDEIGDFVRWTKDHPLNVRFIEWMPFDGNVWSRGKMVSFREMFDAACAAVPSLRGDPSPPAEGAPLPASLQRLPDPRGEVARNFCIPGHVGTVSFIASMTKPFCGDCNRLRLMADGNLKVCLFGASEVSLRDALRGGASERELLAIMHAALGRKRAAHAGMFELAASKNRAMVKIGG